MQEQTPLPAFVLPDGPDGTLLRVHAVPRASKTSFAGFHGDAIKVRIQAPPEDGRANVALCEWVARLFNLSRRSVELVSGCSSREKTLRLSGIKPSAAAQIAIRVTGQAEN